MGGWGWRGERQRKVSGRWDWPGLGSDPPVLHWVPRGDNLLESSHCYLKLKGWPARGPSLQGCLWSLLVRGTPCLNFPCSSAPIPEDTFPLDSIPGSRPGTESLGHAVHRGESESCKCNLQIASSRLRKSKTKQVSLISIVYFT